MHPVTVRQCVVLVDSPKPMLPCGDRPFLAWLLREFVRYGVEEFLLLTGHLPAEMKTRMQRLSALLPRAARIVISEADTVLQACERLDGRFLLCSGRSLFDCNLAHMLAADSVGPSVVGRMVHAGVYLFHRSLLEQLAPDSSLEAGILPRLAARGKLRDIADEGYFLDIGSQQEFARAQQEIPRLLRRRALFLDRDGVINVDHGWVGSRDRFEWMPGARAAIRSATDAGWHVFVVTNQSGVARGHYDEVAVAALHAWMTDEVRRAGGTIDDIRYCPFHEDASVAAYRRTSDWRKPAPGMLLDLLRAWEVDPVRCVLIGDQPSDMAAAAAAGIDGHRFVGGNLLDFVNPLLCKASDLAC
jgi:D,D-heptose 1,7-bisphosphate phosphatase